MNNDIVSGFDDEKDEHLRITLENFKNVPGILALHLNGYLDTYNSTTFQKRVSKAVGIGFNKLIFQCARLNYVSSTGIGSFTMFLKLVKPLGGDVVLIDVQSKVNDVFQLLGFSQFFIVKENIENALAHLTKKADSNANSVFPKTFPCPVCAKSLKAIKTGRFRCSGCKTIIAIDESGNVIVA
jgi:anti-sigma B factor antagonist